MKGKHEGRGDREKVETGRQGAKKWRKEMEEQHSKGRKRPLSLSKCVSEHKRVAGYFWGAIIGT